MEFAFSTILRLGSANPGLVRDLSGHKDPALLLLWTALNRQAVESKSSDRATWSNSVRD
jgi:hypothetical protein